MFELAELEQSSILRRRYLTFTVIGGGATGVEICGSITDLIDSKFLSKYRNIRADDINVILIEAGNQLLTAFSKTSGEKAYDHLINKKVTIKLNEPVKDIQNKLVRTHKSDYQTFTTIWCASLKASYDDLNNDIGKDKQGRIHVNQFLALNKHENVYCIGDGAHAKDENKEPYPGLASVAKQQGLFVANDLIKRYKKLKRKSFQYNDKGTMAIISKHNAIAEFKKMFLGSKSFHGKKGWFLWGFVHIYYVLSIKNKLSIFLNWMTYYFLNRPTSLLIIKRDKKVKDK